jgi:anaerobic magnesium-protoporphyrin IX monomethyl ester cyclase
MSGKGVCLLFPSFREGFILRKVPLGLAYLAAALEEKGIRAVGHNLCCDSLEDIRFEEYDWVGIACLTPLLAEIRRLTAHIRERNPDVRIAVGGPHPTYNPTTVLDELPLVDFAVAGEGEVSFPRLVLGEDPGSIPGVYRRAPGGGSLGRPPERVDIHAIPDPDGRAFDHGNLERRNPFRGILASRGCPWRCPNCQPMLDLVQPVGLRTPREVLDEIRRRQDAFGETYFGFVDSEFPLRKAWLPEFHALVRDESVEFRFHCNSRADLLDEAVLAMFRDMGINRLAVGIESGVPRVTNGILRKGIDLEGARRMFEHGQRVLGIRMHGHFMIGIPGETKEDWEATLAYARDLPAASIEFNMLTPWPGTGFWDLCRRRGYLVEEDCSRFNEKRRSFIRTEDFTEVEVEEFYGKIRETLVAEGYANSDDGSVYFHPEFEGADDQEERVPCPCATTTPK